MGYYCMAVQANITAMALASASTAARLGGHHGPYAAAPTVMESS